MFFFFYAGVDDLVKTICQGSLGIREHLVQKDIYFKI